MKVSEITKVTCEVMYIEPAIYGMWSRATRYSEDNWTLLMGESEEPIYGELVEELEEAYQIAKGSK